MRLATHAALDTLCGEYIVGTLRGAARRRFERALRDEPPVAARLAHWQALFAPGYSTTMATRPSPDVWHRLHRELNLARYATPWWRKLGFWQGWAGIATAAPGTPRQ